MSSTEIKAPHELIRDTRWLVRFSQSENALASVTLDWDTGVLRSRDKTVYSELSRLQFGNAKTGKDAFVLNPRGLSLFSKLLIDTDQLIGQVVAGRYKVIERLAEGSESTTFLAIHQSFGSRVCLKVIRPGHSTRLDERLKKFGGINISDVLVLPNDLIEVLVKDQCGHTVHLPALIFPYVESATLEDFLEKEAPLSPFFILEFLNAIASGLAGLEEAGLTHGDLHGRNILCQKNKNRGLDIRIIDIGINEESGSQFGEHISDLSWVKRHLSTILVRTRVPKMSIQKHLGAETFELLKYVFAQEHITFTEILQLIQDNRPYKEFRRNQKEFIRREFTRLLESPLSFLRYEEIDDPAQARHLFLPYPQLFRPLSKFGSAILYGHRGSGKSSYLASMAYAPSASASDTERSGVDYRKLCGIFFACRQGEFKQFSRRFLSFDSNTEVTIKHILILKIIRKTIGALRDSLEHDNSRLPRQIEGLTEYLAHYVGGGVDITLRRIGVRVYHNLHATLLRNEIEEIDYLFRRTARGNSHRLLTERELVRFFEIVRTIEPTLATAQFAVLFDDAGDPNVPKETQKVLNELIKSSNSVFCVKVSAERFSYTKECADGKPLEDSHDYAQFDVSNTLRLSNKNRKPVEEHFRELIRLRLEGFNSTSIEDYLGKEPVSNRDLVSGLAGDKRQRDASYSGWQMVWQLADRTPRHLLEMVATIFDSAEIDQTTQASLIPPPIQDEAIVAYSTRKLRSLSFIPGAYGGRKKDKSVGATLMACTTAFGKIARAYLARGRMKTKTQRIRYYEVLAIERDDSETMSVTTSEILELLVRYGVFDDTNLTASRDDKIRKPIFIINRVYCPALQISFRREMHWRLSTSRFERFLQNPENFVSSIIKQNQDEAVHPQREFDFGDKQPREEE